MLVTKNQIPVCQVEQTADRIEWKPKKESKSCAPPKKRPRIDLLASNIDAANELPTSKMAAKMAGLSKKRSMTAAMPQSY